MLWCIYGRPGAGKTLYAMQSYVIPYVARNRRIVTNITGLSVAGISGCAHVPPTLVRIDRAETIADVCRFFDDSDNCRDVLFVLDEVQNMLKTDAMTDWLFQRLTLMRKQNVDFVLVTQVPTRIPAEIRDLAEGCSLFVRAYSFGSRSRTLEYRYNCGTPKMVSDKPSDYDSMEVRKLDPKIFTCYCSYIDNQIMGGSEDKKAMERTTKIWASSKAKRLYASLAIPVVVCLVGYMIVSSLFRSVSAVGISKKIDEKKTELASPLSGDKQKVVEDEDEDEEMEMRTERCFVRMVCDSETCKTDVGEFPAKSYDARCSCFQLDSLRVRQCSQRYKV